MRVLIAPNAFKGTYTASQVAQGIARTFHGHDCDLMPLADGGPGTLDCFKGKGRVQKVKVHDALGRPRMAKWLALPGKVALIEAAEAVGLTLIEPHKRDAVKASSVGLGELMLAALRAGSRELLIGLGGSATTDAGLGMAEVFGQRRVKIRVLCDVDNPLYGQRGAAFVYGPQKGAGKKDVLRLDRRLRAVASLFPRALAMAPGAGAAGGLGFGLMAFCGAKLVPGARSLMKLNGFEERLKRCDMVITGEGRFDSQSLRGKLPAVVAREAYRLKKPCLLLCGSAEKGVKLPGCRVIPLT